MRVINLTQGQSALVDDEDYELLSQWKWYAQFNPHTKSYYAGRREAKDGDWKKGQNVVLMHRRLLGLSPGDPAQVDHIDHDTLNNQRYNLRIVSLSENVKNKRTYSNNKSGFKGVFRLNNSWRAYIRVNGKLNHLGSFPSPEDAARAYDVAALKHFGEFACLNFPQKQVTA